MPDLEGMGLAVDIAYTTYQAGYKMVEVAIKYFRHIGMLGEHSENFIHFDIDPYKLQDVIWRY